MLPATLATAVAESTEDEDVTISGESLETSASIEAEGLPGFWSGVVGVEQACSMFGGSGLAFGLDAGALGWDENILRFSGAS